MNRLLPLSKKPSHKNEITLLLNHDLHQLINTGGDNNNDDILNSLLNFIYKYGIWTKNHQITKKIELADFDRKLVKYDDISPILTFYDIFVQCANKKVMDNNTKNKNLSDDAGSDDDDIKMPRKKENVNKSIKVTKPTKSDDSDDSDELNDIGDLDGIEFGTDTSDSDETSDSDDLDSDNLDSDDTDDSDSNDSDTDDIEIVDTKKKGSLSSNQKNSTKNTNKATPTKQPTKQTTKQPTKPPTKPPTKTTAKPTAKPTAKKSSSKK